MRSIRFLLLGVLVSLVLGVVGAPHLNPIRDHSAFADGCGAALIVAVFGSGLAVERRVTRSSWWLIGILLAVVMPVSVALVAVFGRATMGLDVGAAVLLGAVLAPTDPVLAGEVGLPPPGTPDVGEPRLSLHTEAGANDGLASPLVVAGVAIAAHGGTAWVGHWLVWQLLYRAGIAVVIGGLAGRYGAPLLGRVRDGEGARRSLLPALALGLAVAVYAITVLADGYGLVAVFVAGITFRRAEPDDRFHARVHDGTERVGRVLEFVVLVALGAALTPSGLAVPGVAGWLLAPLLILVIRPALVTAAAVGSPLARRERRFLGAFGVRGVAAVYYAVTLVGERALPAGETRTVVWTTLACVVVSIVGHGLAAGPLTARWLAPAVSAGITPEAPATETTRSRSRRRRRSR